MGNTFLNSAKMSQEIDYFLLNLTDVISPLRDI